MARPSKARIKSTTDKPTFSSVNYYRVKWAFHQNGATKVVSLAEPAKRLDSPDPKKIVWWVFGRAIYGNRRDNYLPWTVSNVKFTGVPGNGGVWKGRANEKLFKIVDLSFKQKRKTARAAVKPKPTVKAKVKVRAKTKKR